MLFVDIIRLFRGFLLSLQTSLSCLRLNAFMFFNDKTQGRSVCLYSYRTMEGETN